jgi:predicted nucleic acid-binding protein
MIEKVKPSVYLETSVISYLTSRTSRDIVVVAHQEVTREWWQEQRKHYRLVISEVVLQEVTTGDDEAGDKRFDLIKGLEVLTITEQVQDLANAFVARRILPMKAMADALHIAISAIHHVQFLMTWNCKHIANAVIEKMIKQVCEEYGYEPTLLCTPLELMDWQDYGATT